MKHQTVLLAGLASLTLAAPLRADVTLVITGGNASRSVIFDRIAAVLSGETIVNHPTDGNIRSWTGGTIPGQPGLGIATVHAVLPGANAGIISVRDQSSVATATGASLTPQVAVSSTAPETIGIDSSIFTQNYTLVVPFVFIKNNNIPNTIHGVNNLTQRQATYLFGASGSIVTAFFGGESTTAPIYLVGRNTAAAVRAHIDANTYFSGTPANYTTNASGQPILHPGGGHGSALSLTNDLVTIPNAIGTIAVQDLGGFTALSYEGVPYSAVNVAKGSYPIWGYERWLWRSTGAGVPSASQQAVINALLAAIKDTTYQHTSVNVVGKFVPIDDLEVERTADGGPITSTIY